MTDIGNDRPTLLILTANPFAESKLRLDIEVREIQNGLRNSSFRPVIQQQWATRPQDLRRALLDHKPTYVHFCGHGAGKDGIVLEGGLVDAEALAGLFGLFADTVKCVVLNACYSAVQASAIARHIDFVVGMKREIGDPAAIEFAVAFYDALGSGKSVKFAFDLGCRAIQVARLPDHATPALLTRDILSFAPQAADPPPSASPHDWDGAPSVSLLYGREMVAEELRTWILDDRCRVVLITGLGGIGKTDLAICVIRGGNCATSTSATLARGIHHGFYRIIWRSLLNAPRPQDLFADILVVLSDFRHTTHSPPPKQIADILLCMQNHRCLLILDNAEAILQPGNATMRYRDGYEDYGTLFETLGKTDHQSCLLITSREKPRAIAEMEGMKRPVRSLALGGIGMRDAQQLFAQIAVFSGSDANWETIVRLYHGNPLALELAARHIDQVFAGSLQAFLNEGRPLFTDLQTLLDWHLDRLSDDEKELIYWLAIEREPVTLATLQGDLVSPASRERIPSTLQDLQRRVPLEKAVAQRFAIQPVLIERVTARLVNQVGLFASIASPELLERLSEHLAMAVGEELQVGHMVLLNSYSFVKATAKEHIRDSQKSFILAPIRDRFMQGRRGRDLKHHLLRLLSIWRDEHEREPGYVAGNILNLLSHSGMELQGCDFSRLCIRQACLHEVNLRETDFSFCDFHATSFKHAFGTIYSLCYSPDGSLLALGDDNGEIELFRSPTGEFVRRCVGHSAKVNAVAFGPDGSTIASASADGTIRLWQTSTGRCTNVLLGHEGWVYSIAFTPSGESLASTGEDGTVRLWNFFSGEPAMILAATSSFVAAVAISADGLNLAFGGSAGTVTLLRSPDYAHHLTFNGHAGRIRALAFAPNGGLLASGGEDLLIDLWDLNNERHYAVLEGHSAPVRSLSFGQQGNVLASASDDHTVRFWDTDEKKSKASIYVSPSAVVAVCFSAKGGFLATGSVDSALRLWDSETHECILTMRGYSNKTWALAFCQDPHLLLAGTEDGKVRVWDTRSARATLELGGHLGRIWGVAASYERRLLASASADLTARIWDCESGECRHELRGHTDWIRAVVFLDEIQCIASAGEDGQVLIWDAVTGHCLMRISSGMSRVFALASCSHEAGLLACGGSSHDIRIFSPRDGSFFGCLQGHRRWVRGIVSCGDQLLASCSEDGTIKFWDVSRVECLSTIDIGEKILSIAVGGARRFILTGSGSGTLQCRGLADGRLRGETKAHTGPIWALAVNTSDEVVASTGDDGIIRLWTLPDLRPYPLPALRPPRPYEGMNVTGATGLTAAELGALEALGGISMPSA